jgi:hypothetical protein
MPANKTRKKSRKKVRYKEVRLKLTKSQQESLDNYCRARRTTRTKLIKKMIRPFLSNYARNVPEEVFATANQLDLFGAEHQELKAGNF